MAPIGSRLADPTCCAQAGFRAASVPGSIRGNCSNSRTGESKINQAWTQNPASASHKQAEAPQTSPTTPPSAAPKGRAPMFTVRKIADIRPSIVGGVTAWRSVAELIVNRIGRSAGRLSGHG